MYFVQPKLIYISFNFTFLKRFFPLLLCSIPHVHYGDNKQHIGVHFLLLNIRNIQIYKVYYNVVQ